MKRTWQYICGIFLCLFLCGCSVALKPETFGILSTKTFNNTVDQIEESQQLDLKNQVQIAQTLADVCKELEYQAKKSRDDAALARAIEMRVKAIQAAKEAGILSEVTFDRAPDPPFDWAGLIQMILAALGAAGVPGMGFLHMLNQNKKKDLEHEKERTRRVTAKARKYAHSTEIDDIDSDEDFHF